MGGRKGRVALGVVAATSALLACGPLATPAAGAERAAEQMLLRLDELPRGYVFEQGSSCEPVEPRPYGDKPGLTEWAEHFSPHGCHFHYRRLYRSPDGSGPDPPIVVTAAVMTRSAEAVDAVGPVARELVENLTFVRGVLEVPLQSPIGESPRAFRSGEYDSEYGPEAMPGVTVLWRSGTALEAIYVGGWNYSRDERAALALATRQQAHVEAPTPYLVSEGDDVAVYFENPKLRLPAYWLGRTFAPGHGLEPSYFQGAFPSSLRGSRLKGLEQTVEYVPALFLDSWSPRGWADFVRTEIGRRQWSWHCTRSRTIRLLNGHATIYAAYKKGYPVCPGFRPHHFSAHVYLPGVVIAIGEASCRWCQGTIDTYESWRGMEAVVRGLRRWRPSEG